MRRVERFIDLDPCIEWEEKLLNALAGVLETVPDEEAQFALGAFEGLGIHVFHSRLMAARQRLRDLSPSP